MDSLAAFRAEIGDIPNTDHPNALRAKSHDWSEVSPILRKLLDGKSADLVVSPRIDVDESCVLDQLSKYCQGR